MRRKGGNSREGNLTISVVVSAFNEEAHIARLLRSLKSQTRPPREIIVIDDGSRDRTGEIAEANGAAVVRMAHRGPARGRNVGAARATGDVLVFLDGDMACAPAFLERLVAPMDSPEVAGTFTRDIYIGNLENRWASAYAALRSLRDGRLLPSDFPDVWDNFRAVRRELFLAVGGYEDVGYGEDRTLAVILNARRNEI